mgnify:CR=1 FL=1
MNTDAALVICDYYKKWRDVIFEIEPDQVDISQESADTVYGVIVDIGMRDRQTSAKWAISLTAFPTGEASFHPTPGGSVVGVGSYGPQVAKTAQEIVRIAQTLWDKTSPTEDYSLPDTGYAQFLFLTTGGVRVYQGHLHDIQTPANPFGTLLSRFGLIRHIADRILDEKNASRAE